MFKSNKRKNDHVYTFYDIEDFIEDLFEVQTHFLPKDKIKDKQNKFRDERMQRLHKYVSEATNKQTHDIPGFDDLGLLFNFMLLICL